MKFTGEFRVTYCQVKNWKCISRMQERTPVWGSLFGAACPIPEGHNKAERKKPQPFITLQNTVEKYTFMCLYCKIENRLVEIIQKYPVLHAVCYPNYEQLSSTEDTNTNVSSSKTQQAEFCHIRRFQDVPYLACPTHMHHWAWGTPEAGLCGFVVSEPSIFSYIY